MKNRLPIIGKTLGLTIILTVTVMLGTGRSLAALSDSGHANPVIHRAPSGMKSLDSAWSWALDASKKEKKSFYIGYIFERNTEEKKGIHIHQHGNNEIKPLGQYIYGDAWKKKHGDNFCSKEVALLFRFDSPVSSPNEFSDLHVLSLDSRVEPDGLPAYFLGSFDAGQSLDFVVPFFHKAKQPKHRKKIVAAVGMHGTFPKAFNLLKKATGSAYAAEVRKDAVFWIAHQKNSGTLDVILRVFENDESHKVRKSCIFAIYLVRSKEADTALIKIARKGEKKEYRKNAIFWLGQRAGQRMARVLGDVIDNDKEDTGIKNAAVFALSQMPNGVDKLIKIATTHKNIKIRKKALFWLGESGDPRAIDVIEKILTQN